MKIRKIHIIAIVFAAALIAAGFVFFRGEDIFLFLFAIGLFVLMLPFLVSLVVEGNIEKEKNERFLEFARNLSESVKAGTPVGKSILNMSNKDFGSLTPHVKKLANQISLGIPLSRAMETFSYEVDSSVVKRAVTLIKEAENAGGEIDYILDSVAESIYEIEKLKRERKSAVSNLIVQGYIIFFIFIGIMLVMQFKILPLTAGVSSVGTLSSGDIGAYIDGGAGGGASANAAASLARPLFYLLIVQGFFSGLTIGKISEGSLKAGIKHSIILIVMALMITSGARAFL